MNPPPGVPSHYVQVAPDQWVHPALAPQQRKIGMTYEEKVSKFGQGYVNEFCGPKPPKRIRQSTKPLLNKLESEWLEQLKIMYPGREFHAQSVKFRLANGVTYCPDVINFRDFEKPRTWEVKGKQAWDDAIVKLKVFASSYPGIDVILVWKINNEWAQQDILP